MKRDGEMERWRVVDYFCVVEVRGRSVWRRKNQITRERPSESKIVVGEPLLM